MAGGNDGAGFWPAYVDALTNVVIAMVFVVVVLALSLSFSAQMAAKKMAEKMIAAKEAAEAARPKAAQPPSSSSPTSPSDSSATPSASGTGGTRVPVRTLIEVKAPSEQQAAKVEKIAVTDRYFAIEYPANALLFDADAEKKLIEAAATLKKALASAPAGTKIAVIASGPQIELSENQRSGYFRANSVRNLLIEQGISSNDVFTRFDMKSKPQKGTISVSLEAAKP